MPVPHVLPTSMQVWQHFVLLLQPVLLMLPLGMIVRQKMAPLRFVLAAIVAPVRSASTRQTRLRLALVKLAPLALALSRLESLRLQLVQLTFSSALEPVKRQLARLAAGPGTQAPLPKQLPGGEACALVLWRRRPLLSALPLPPLPRPAP